MRPGFEYFTATIMGKLRPQLDLFKAARYLVPCRAVELGLNATLLDELKIMKVIQRGKISIHSLVQELPQYLAVRWHFTVSKCDDLLERKSYFTS